MPQGERETAAFRLPESEAVMNGNLFVRVLRRARESSTACASINILNYNTARAVIHAAERAGRPVILQPSVGTVRRYGVSEMFRMIDGLRSAASVPVALHLDHCRDEELARACADAGWDAVMMDYSALPLEENIRKTREMAAYAHPRGVAVEGEVGVILGVEEEVSSKTASAASYEDTLAFIEGAGVDAIAPSIGTAHGLYTGEPVPIVIHGGTGLPAADFRRLIALGAAKINLSTALKQVYLGESRRQLENPDVAPVAFDEAVENAASLLMEKFIRLFAGEDVEL